VEQDPSLHGSHRVNVFDVLAQLRHNVALPDRT
jgi:hypothetical protein